MVCEAETTGICTFDRTAKSEVNARRTLFGYSLRSFSSFRFETAEIRKKHLNSHSEIMPRPLILEPSKVGLPKNLDTANWSKPCN